MREADFSERIKTILCERVGGRCSNPNCRRETLGPHREGDKRLSMGEAAHILGASPKGARYDARMTKEERESINNGIWLCSACHTFTKIGESPMDGSSITISLGLLIRARPMASICCSPPESVPARCPLRSSRRGNLL